MAPIAYFVHGRGRGHASRTRAVVAELRRRGREVQLFAGGQALPLLADVDGVTPVTCCPPGPGLARRFGRRVRDDLARLSARAPWLVVSDGDGPSVHAAWIAGIPSLAVGHGLLFGHCRLPSGLPGPARILEAVNALSSSWPSARRVVVHFHPLEPRTRGTSVARPDIAPGLLAQARRDDFLLAYFRDDDGGALLERLVARRQRVVAFGAPGSVPPGVERHDPCPTRFAEHLGRCYAVVGSAGNHLPAECALLGKPLLATFAPRDIEQGMNAQLIAQAGIGLAARLDRVDDAEIDAWLAMRPGPSGERPIHGMPPASVVIAEQIESLSSGYCTPALSPIPYAEEKSVWS